MRAYPSATFAWEFKHSEIVTNGGRFSSTNKNLGDDLYISELTILSITESDYGAYTCKATNAEGSSKTILNLQPRGPPGPSTDLETLDAGFDFLQIVFEPGFNGGFPTETSYQAQITSSVKGGDLLEPCEIGSCLIEGLQQNTEYRVRIFAENPQGRSPLSAGLLTKTTLDPQSIPAPTQVFVKSDSGRVVFTVPEVARASAVSLTALLEVQNGNEEWEQVPHTQMSLNDLQGEFDLGVSVPDKYETRVRLCAKISHDLCGPYAMAKHGKSLLVCPFKTIF